VAAAGEGIFWLMLRVASGERTKSEGFDFGTEFAPWVLGATIQSVLSPDVSCSYKTDAHRSKSGLLSII
jgi:hypothetical protein